MSVFDKLKDKLNNYFENDGDYWVMWVSEENEFEDDCDLFDGCYFHISECPELPQHFGCKCQIIKIDNPIPNVTAFADGDIRKFTEYIFVPENSKGKFKIFENWGFTIKDSEFLLREIKKQALEKYCKGEYKYKGRGYRNPRIEIIIDIKNKFGVVQHIKTGWNLLPNGELKLSTPYSGHTY